MLSADVDFQTLVSAGFEGAIISIGPETDAMIEYFRLADTVVPRLRDLTQTVRSSRWEEVLRVKWGLTFEQASKISTAMQSDLAARASQFPVSIPAYLYQLGS